MNAPLENPMQAAMRHVLALKPELAPRLAPHPLSGRAGVPEAIEAARRGDLATLDAIELTWLNSWGPRLRAENFCNDERLVSLAVEIRRSFGPRGEPAIAWALVRPCGRCYGRVVADPRCRFCGGRKHLSDDYEIVFTDWDLNAYDR